MTTTRIHDLAAEFGIPSEQLLGMLKELDIFVRSHLSPLKPEQVATLASLRMAAKMSGASFADARIARQRQNFVFTREQQIQNVVDTDSTGCGVRVLVDGTWGFAATRRMISAPAPLAHSSGKRPAPMMVMVMIFGRRRCTVPSACAATMSSRVRSLPSRMRRWNALSM